ncbi:IclR family transcriptional regulator [Sporomusa acidovorans]|uniref:Transcriptional regulator KdgR n=1 Tax=Sporomusa acidovorans (strain ATCC 49682 / DSM 3132 / Mol) TaxID=1123286 RepID=A0ABZ3J034_SPOA4|nr:IclR family transcriptional regulator [Sporomusa acidovorans]OZC22266.1 transcriptional regulator KdgR [Sporomusa acidovorans DSM 3132]SDF34797.1 transcriptional regulator, IclR family [Sporomusa acidovorans]
MNQGRKPAKDKNKYLVASVDRAIELLFILESSPREMGVTEISRQLGVQKSTVHNLLQTLLARDFVRQTDTGHYTLGFRLMPLGLACTERLNIRRIASPYLKELAAEAEEVVLLAVLSAGQLTIIDKVEPTRPVFLIPRFDYCNTFHSSALGKVFLAYSPDEFLEKVTAEPLTRYTDKTITDKQMLMTELANVREQGYSVASNETIEGVTCLGAPIMNANGKIEAAITVSGATAWFTEKRRESVVRLMKGKAEAISAELGFRG